MKNWQSIREAEKEFFFSSMATKKGGKVLATKNNHFFLKLEKRNFEKKNVAT